MADARLAGGCTCGRVRFRLEAEPIFVNCCHCRWCQRETGSAFLLNAMIEAAHVTLIQGETEAVLTPSESGNGQIIHRCPTCQIALWSHYSGAGPKVCYVRVGTLDIPDALPPQAHIHTASKQPWVILPPDIPAFTEFYERENLWPERSLARARAVRERG